MDVIDKNKFLFVLNPNMNINVTREQAICMFFVRNSMNQTKPDLLKELMI
jgi:hypothetical protein